MRALTILWGFVAFFVPTVLDEAAFALLPGVAAPRAQRGPERLRLALQRLGGAFVKFGQLLSMRADLLPKRYCDALEGLYDKVEPFPGHEARRVVEESLGAPVDQLFEYFDDRPLAAASIGQVHEVVLGRGPDRGTRAVIKVQRPGADARIQQDAFWLLGIGWFVDATSIMGQIKLLPTFRDFVRWTKRETNFTQEAKNADRLYEETEWNHKQRIPYVYWAYTRPRVLTLEFLEGMSVSEVLRRAEARDPHLDDELARMGCDRRSIARHILQNFHLQAFVGEVFHADPHPGNLIVMPDNVIGYVDFGLLGRMSPEALREQAALLDAVRKKDIERLFVSVLDVLDAPRGLLVTDYYDHFAEVADTWLDACDNPGASLQEKSVANLALATMDLARQIGLPLSMSTTLYFKAAISVDASVLRLVPEIDYHAETVQALRLVRLREIEKRLAPSTALDTALQSWMLFLSGPDFVTEQIIQYQQTTNAMYRKINQAPLIIAGLVRFVAVLVAALGFVLGISLLVGEVAIPDWLVGFEVLEHALLRVAPGYPLLLFSALLLWWVARIIAGQAMQKVQRTEG